jgi:hypothetical protein
MLDDVGLVHMNGRLYDARLGRVMSADPIIQAAGMIDNFGSYQLDVSTTLQ